MKISIEHHNDQFNVSLSSKEGAQPFLTVKGCRVVEGRNGKFVSWPARKLDTGKYWNHVWVSEGFATAVLDAYDASAPKQAPRKAAEAVDDSIPF